MKKEIDYELINDLYIKYLNECDPFTQRKRKEEIKNRVSPYEFLKYSERSLFPFETFGKIYSVYDFFETIEEMQKRGKTARL